MATDAELRDQLALDRTLLANERTLLAYVRTSLSLIGAGVASLQLFETPSATLGGWSCIAAGAAILPVGLWRYAHVRRRVKIARERPTTDSA